MFKTPNPVIDKPVVATIKDLSGTYRAARLNYVRVNTMEYYDTEKSRRYITFVGNCDHFWFPRA
jgi:hypothetical protein